MLQKTKMQRTPDMKFLWRVCNCLIVLSAVAGSSQAAPPTIIVLHAFNGTDGNEPVAPLLQASDGNFYGTTYFGGDDGNGCVKGCLGTIFKISPQGQFTLLHTFVAGGTSPFYQNGANPWGGLVEGPDGYLYGTTYNGGAGGGVFYKISKTGDFQKLSNFAAPDSTNPQGSLVLNGGFFYGTTTSPPAYPALFQMSSTGVYTNVKTGEIGNTLIYTGIGTPANGMIQASDGNLYGVGVGGVYRVTPPLGFAVVYLFTPNVDGEGATELIQASDGNLYGVTYGNGQGVYRMSLAGAFQKIYALSVADTGVGPNALLQASDGNLWGTTANDTGSSGGGKVYTITTAGTFMQSITLTKNTGYDSVAPLIQGTDGKLYGTASAAGLLPDGKTFGAGTVFVIDAGLSPKLTSIAITAANGSIPKGTNEQFTATGTYGDNSTADITTQVTWNSSNMAAATIGMNTGLASGVGTGSTNITASLNGVTSNTFVLTVNPVTLQSISITGPASILAGGNAQFTATGTYSDNSMANITTQVTWNSSDKSVASIGASTGLATGVAPGPTNITASLNGMMSNLASLTVRAVPVVTAYKVLFGSQSYSLAGTARKRLPWQITGIQVVFSQPITSGNVNSLTGVTAMGLTGLGTNTLTWTINPLIIGNFATALAGGGANALLDSAGDPLGGGAGFSQNLKVLLGDFNDDGAVSSADLVGVNNATIAPYNLFADINGDGVVNTADVLIVRAKIGTTLQ